MGEWKTIDSAPRDGTPVMLFSPQLSLDDPFNVDGGLVWVSGGYGKGVLGVWRGDSNKNPPTHWMPLPPPPKD